MKKTKIRIKLRKGDSVRIIAGKFRGKTDFISKISSKKNVIHLSSISRKKYDTSSPESKKNSDLKEETIPIHPSNVLLIKEIRSN
jgi:ribosomal protein L24